MSKLQAGALELTRDSKSGDNPGGSRASARDRAHPRNGKPHGQEGKDRHGEHLRRDHHRRRSQRTHQRRLLRALGRAHRGAGGPRQDRRRGRHQRAVPRPPRDQGHHVLVRDVPDAAHDHPRAEPEAARLRRHAVRSVLPGVPRRPRDHGVRRRREEELRLDRAVLEEGRRHAAEVGGVDEGRRRRARPAAPAGAAEARLARDRRPGRERAVRVEDAQARRARRRRRDAPVHDERDAICSTTGSSPTRSRRCSP